MDIHRIARVKFTNPKNQVLKELKKARVLGKNISPTLIFQNSLYRVKFHGNIPTGWFKSKEGDKEYIPNLPEFRHLKKVPLKRGNRVQRTGPLAVITGRMSTTQTRFIQWLVHIFVILTLVINSWAIVQYENFHSFSTGNYQQKVWNTTPKRTAAYVGGLIRPGLKYLESSYDREKLMEFGQQIAPLTLKTFYSPMTPQLMSRLVSDYYTLAGAISFMGYAYEAFVLIPNLPLPEPLKIPLWILPKLIASPSLPYLARLLIPIRDPLDPIMKWMHDTGYLPSWFFNSVYNRMLTMANCPNVTTPLLASSWRTLKGRRTQAQKLQTQINLLLSNKNWDKQYQAILKDFLPANTNSKNRKQVISVLSTIADRPTDQLMHLTVNEVRKAQKCPSRPT